MWSRAATREDSQFEAGALLEQRNAYLVQPYEGPERVQKTRQRLIAPLQVGAGKLPREATAGGGQLARPGETEETAPLKEAIWEALRQVRDQELMAVDANAVDMGYVYDVRVEGDLVRVLITMPHQGRPRYEFIGGPLRARLLEVEGVREVVVDFTWEPAWDLARLTARGRKIMGLEP